MPGKFLLFDKDTPAQNMKDAERSTYTFISEMEEGGSVSAQDLVKKNAGGASVHASQDLREKTESEKGPEDGIKVLSISGTSSAPMPAKKAAAPALSYTVGEKAQALWTDGKWYDVVIKKIISETKYQISQSTRSVCTAPGTSVGQPSGGP